MLSKFKELQNKIKKNFRNKALLENVFIHRSYLNENKNFYLPSNEKLEFLGDSVLSLITSSYLFKNFPKLVEGEYTEIKAAIVRTESLAHAAQNLGLGSYLYLSKGQHKEKGRQNINILADCFESLIGAVFLDLGFDAAYEFVLDHLFQGKLDLIIKNKLYLSPKSRLQEYSQARYKVTPTYIVLQQKGPEHQRTFKVQVVINSKKLAAGEGKSKKEAEEKAARTALEKIV